MHRPRGLADFSETRIQAISTPETPFGGIKDSGLGYKEGVQEVIKSFTNLKTYSLPWP